MAQLLNKFMNNKICKENDELHSLIVQLKDKSTFSWCVKKALLRYAHSESLPSRGPLMEREVQGDMLCMNRCTIVSNNNQHNDKQ